MVDNIINLREELNNISLESSIVTKESYLRWYIAITSAISNVTTIAVLITVNMLIKSYQVTKEEAAEENIALRSESCSHKSTLTREHTFGGSRFSYVRPLYLIRFDALITNMIFSNPFLRFFLVAQSAHWFFKDRFASHSHVHGAMNNIRKLIWNFFDISETGSFHTSGPTTLNSSPAIEPSTCIFMTICH